MARLVVLTHLRVSSPMCFYECRMCNFPCYIRAQRICSSVPPLSGADFSNTAQILTELMVMPQPPPGVGSLQNLEKGRYGLGAAAGDTEGKLLI